MKVKKVELKKFRRFHDLTIDLGESPAKIIALVGPNGSGKSSIFDAFEDRTKDYYGGQLDPAFVSKAYYTPGEPREYSRNEAVKVTTDSTSLGKTSFYIRTPYRFSSSIGVDAIRKLPSMVDEEHAASSIQLDTKLQQNYARLMSRFVEEVYGKDKTGKQWEEEQLGLVNGILEKVLDIRVSNLGNVADGRGQLWFKKGSSVDFPYMNLSSGEKEVIDIVIDLIIKTRDFNDTVFCIDEPELHLNTKIQRKLLVEIERLVPDNCQLWIATHSMGFLRALQEDLKDKTAVLDFSEKNFDESIVLQPIQRTRKNWTRIFETALEDAAGLLAPKCIIYCEGRKEPSATGEEQGLDAELYNSIFETEFNDTLFVSSGGNTEPESYSEIALAVLGKAFQGVELLLLRDMDINPDGLETTVEQRTLWLAVSSNRRMLDRKEIENYIVDYEIIKKAYPNVTEDGYNAIIPDITDRAVKEKIGGIMRLCGITTDMNKSQFLVDLARFVTKDTLIYGNLKSIIFAKYHAQPT